MVPKKHRKVTPKDIADAGLKWLEAVEAFGAAEVYEEIGLSQYEALGAAMSDAEDVLRLLLIEYREQQAPAGGR